MTGLTHKVKQEGTSDLGRFLREVCSREHNIPRKQLKIYMHDANGSKIWRGIWRDQFGPAKKSGAK